MHSSIDASGMADSAPLDGASAIAVRHAMHAGALVASAPAATASPAEAAGPVGALSTAHTSFRICAYVAGGHAAVRAPPPGEGAAGDAVM